MRTLRRLNEALNSRDTSIISATIDEVFLPDVLIRTPLNIDASGTELMKQLWAVLLRGFPDLHVAVEDVIAEGDKVVSRNTVSGTHQGEYMGVAPTGKSIAWDEIIIARVVDGRVAETWAVVDVASQMRQLGIVVARGGHDPGGRATLRRAEHARRVLEEEEAARLRVEAELVELREAVARQDHREVAAEEHLAATVSS
jgi:predicted ester cyclase